ncbi:MAG: hypothetical protein R6W76_03535 [Caldilinea sp.]
MQSIATFRDTHLLQNPVIRVAGRDRPLSAVVTDAQARALPVDLNSAAPSPTEDFALLDPTLTVAAVDVDLPDPTESAPAPGLSYAAFTPRQRGRFLAWLETPLAPAPPAFQQLYLANLEVRLLEGGELANAATTEVQRLAESDAWSTNVGLGRVAIFAAWLRQDAAALIDWIASGRLPGDLTGLALGMQALLGTPLTAAEVRQVARLWRLPGADLSEAVLTFRLQSLAVALGEEPLAAALAKLDATASTPRPWRCQNRNIRIELPQPDVRRSLELLLAELTILDEAEQQPPETPDHPAAFKNKAQEELSRAHIVLEFRQSRSEYFPFALRLAQKRAGFMQLLDEDRHLVYRVTFRKNEMNAFWQLWNYVQSWTATRVYCSGQELQKSQVYPYSQYLR